MRAKLEDAFQTWQSYLAAGLRRMQDRGALNAEADVAGLATGVVAALQGGLILAQAARSEKPLRAALDLAVGRVALAADMTRPPAPAHAHGPSQSEADVSVGTEPGFTTGQPHVPGAARKTSSPPADPNG
jgi:hypothetical protein